MFKNKEIKVLFYIGLIITLFTISFTIIITNLNYNNYKQKLVKNNNQIVGSIIEKYPQLEIEIINAILNADSTNKSYIKDYGLEDSSSLDYINNNISIYKKNLLKNISYISILLISFFTTVTIFLIYLYKKITKISRYTSNILNEDYSLDIREYEEGIISNLQNDLYKMTIKLKEAEKISKQEKKFLEETLSDISHQLKTPLTSMYVINDILYDDLDNQKKVEFLNNNKEQLERIEWLITSLLKISRLDSGTEILKPIKINISDLINETIKPLTIPAELKNIKFNIEISNKTIVKVDHHWTREALLNIAKNALEHTKTKVDIVVEDNPIYTKISIKDDGEGIDKEDLPHIFKRFYKGKKRNKNSIGIGLNMAKTIIEKENGIIDVETSSLGTTFIVKIFKKNI